MNRGNQRITTAYKVQQRQRDTNKKTNKSKSKRQGQTRRQRRLTEFGNGSREDDFVPSAASGRPAGGYRGNIPAFGDDWTTQRDGSARTFFCNKKGIYLNDDGAEIMNDLAFFDEGNVSIAMFAETNLDWTFPGVIRRLRRYISRVWERYKLSTSSSGLSSATGHQMGGTATIVRGRWSGRAQDAGSDNYGRWSWVTIDGRDTKTTFITAYTPCAGSLGTTGPTTWWRQLWTQHRKQYTNPNPRKLFWTDLAKFIQSKRAEPNHYIDLGLDANEDMYGRPQHPELKRY